MAKALFGHTSSAPDVRLIDEVGSLRRRVQELEQELARARTDNERLIARLELDDDLVRLSRLANAGI